MNSAKKIRSTPMNRSERILKSSRNYLDVNRLKNLKLYSPNSPISTSQIEASTPINPVNCSTVCCNHQHKIDLTPVVWKTPSGDRIVSQKKQLYEEDDDSYGDSYRTAPEPSLKIKTEVNQNDQSLCSFNKIYDVKKKNFSMKSSSILSKNVDRQQSEDVEKKPTVSKKITRHQSFPSRIPVRVVSRKPLADKSTPHPNIMSNNIKPPIFSSKVKDYKPFNSHKAVTKKPNEVEKKKLSNRVTISGLKASNSLVKTQILSNKIQRVRRTELIQPKSQKGVKRLRGTHKNVTVPISPKLLTAARAALRENLQSSSSNSASGSKSSLELTSIRSRGDLLKEAYKDLAIIKCGMVRKMSKATRCNQ
ncbi:hypothetical protein QAD02_011661 [Eretmocerus hayati]|uniref:Uncharacterized protein n=1 Tax=Eretmocerus hayati TaxID=131215 RepID=A0ACC2NXE6_9HYME|nr:hypothetical protein QAD02_011661 [Eretmocerus hayati]